jgi:DNA-binding HxlR family transcriptional regulator
MKFNVFVEQCPSRNVLEGISDKWSILTMTVLSKKRCRFGELKREIGGISSKMLTQTLQKLEKYGFIHREEFDELPLRVEYELTLMGAKLNNILSSLKEWTESNMPEILKSTETYHLRKKTD